MSENQQNQASDLAFQGLTKEQQKTIQRTLQKVQQAYGLNTDGEALVLICKAFAIRELAKDIKESLTPPVSSKKYLKEAMQAQGYESVLTIFDKLWPDILVEVTV